MKNKLTKEEQLLNQKLESVEFDFQDAHWAEMQDMLGKKGFFSKYSSLMKAAAVVISASALVYWLNTSNDTAVSTQPVAEQNIQENKVSQETKDVNPSNISTTSNIKKDISVEEQPSSVEEPIEDVASTWLDNTIAKISQEDPKDEEVQTNSDSPETIVENQEEKAAVIETGDLSDFKIIGKRCLGETVTIQTKSSINEGQIVWYINERKQMSSSSELKVTLNNYDKIKVKAQLVVEGQLVDEKLGSIKAPIVPEIDFTYEDMQNVYYDFHGKLKATPAGLHKYQWMVDGKTIALEGQEVNYPFGRKGIYDVTLTHKTIEGCISKVEKPVAIEQDFKVFVNAFSPNGDGDNDVFIPKMFEIVEGEFMMSIFDGNGKLVFQTNAYNNFWNGRRNNTGELMPVGNYIMKIRIQNEEGMVRNFTERFKIVDL